MGASNIIHWIHVIVSTKFIFFESGDSTNAGSCKGQEKVNEENTYDQLEFNRPVKELVPHYQSSKTLKSIASIENGLEGKNKNNNLWWFVCI